MDREKTEPATSHQMGRVTGRVGLEAEFAIGSKVPVLTRTQSPWFRTFTFSAETDSSSHRVRAIKHLKISLKLRSKSRGYSVSTQQPRARASLPAWFTTHFSGTQEPPFEVLSHKLKQFHVCGWPHAQIQHTHSGVVPGCRRTSFPCPLEKFVPHAHEKLSSHPTQRGRRPSDLRQGTLLGLTLKEL